jgi:HSP90 family molecular chaperone
MSLYQSDPQDSKLSDLISYTYDQAILNEGWQIDNIHAFIQKVNGLIG